MKQTNPNLIGKLLIGCGSLLLIVGSVLVYPYARPRLATRPTRLQAAPTATVTLPAPTIALTDTSSTTPTASPVPSPTATAAITPTTLPTSTMLLTPTSTPPSPVPWPTIAPGEADPFAPRRIVIPTIGIDAPIIPVSLETTTVDGQEQSTWQAPNRYAAGWHTSSAKIGERENLVLNGHNTAHGEVFRDLYTLEPGAKIRLYSDAITKTYTISELVILQEAGQPLAVRLQNARYIMPTADERLTLVTCHPYGSLRNRLIVIAFPADDA